MKNYVLHDLPKEYDKMLAGLFNDSTIISTNQSFSRCTGCFGCWLKTPGECVMHDGMELLGKSILTSDEVVIISKNLYGGFSVSIKRLWDRCIPGILPFFRKINQELHHTPRYQKKPKLKVYFYNADEISDNEKALAKKLVTANALNFMSEDYQVNFIKNPQELMEAIL